MLLILAFEDEGGRTCIPHRYATAQRQRVPGMKRDVLADCLLAECWQISIPP